MFFCGKRFPVAHGELTQDLGEFHVLGFYPSFPANPLITSHPLPPWEGQEAHRVLGLEVTPRTFFTVGRGRTWTPHSLNIWTTDAT